MQEKLKQLELLVNQAASRLQTLEAEVKTLRVKTRQQEETILRLKTSEADLKTLREWKKNTISILKRLEARVDKELARAKEQDKEIN